MGHGQIHLEGFAGGSLQPAGHGQITLSGSATGIAVVASTAVGVVSAPIVTSDQISWLDALPLDVKLQHIGWAASVFVGFLENPRAVLTAALIFAWVLAVVLLRHFRRER